MRHTTLRFALDPTPAQERAFARHAGASRFAYTSLCAHDRRPCIEADRPLGGCAEVGIRPDQHVQRLEEDGRGSPTPMEGKAMAVSPLMVQPAPTKWELRLRSPEPRTP